ncbi:MAG: peptidylprolyl isomerase, partial [Pseudomonadota bacterium]
VTNGFTAGLEGTLTAENVGQAEVTAAFTEARARAVAIESGASEIPPISDAALEKIGYVMVLRSGLVQLGFSGQEIEVLKKGFLEGAQTAELDMATIEVKTPSLEAFIQDRVKLAQAKMLAEQQAAAELARAEFLAIAEAWKTKEPIMVVLETTQGIIELKLLPQYAPIAVANFVGHVESGYYEGLTFHRVIPDFMVQGGDPLGNGAGGESIWGKPFPDEFTQDIRFDKVGKLAMANSGPMTNGSQFFITTTIPTWLNDKHTIFGEVTSGYEFVEAMSLLETSSGDKPLQAQKIIKAYVKQ